MMIRLAGLVQMAARPVCLVDPTVFTAAVPTGRRECQLVYHCRCFSASKNVSAYSIVVDRENQVLAEEN